VGAAEGIAGRPEVQPARGPGRGHIDFEDATPVDGVEGAATKLIWDDGVYQVVRSSPGKLVVDLSGRRGTCRYALVHTGGSNWLAHLMA